MNDCGPSADPRCTTGMTDALPSAQLGVAGSSFLCSGTDLTAPPLILIQTRFQGFSGWGDLSAMTLVDSGASYNFMSSALAKSLGWKIMPAVMHVQLANGENLRSLGQVSGLVTCGKWRVWVFFIVRDLAFDVVFGLPWLVATNPRLDWA